MDQPNIFNSQNDEVLACNIHSGKRLEKQSGINSYLKKLQKFVCHVRIWSSEGLALLLEWNSQSIYI